MGRRLDNLGFLTLALRHNLTIVGKLWIAVIVFLRLLVILGIGYPLYQDEQAKFTCDSMQPGCSNVCYDAFSPISHCRFWFAQAVVLCLPLVIFITYVTHKLPLQDVGCPCQHPQNPAEPSPFRKVPVGRASSVLKGGETNLDLEEVCGEILAVNEDLRPGRRTHNFCEAYMLQLILRALLEAGFGASQYYLFGFMVPKKFVCSRYPCANVVTCYPSRPTEKTLLANFMFGVTALSFLLNFADLIHVIKQAVRRGKRRRMLMRNFYQEEPYHDMPSGTQVLPEHKVPQAHGSQARQRRESGGSAGGGPAPKPGQERAAFKQPVEGVSDNVALSNTNSNNVHLRVLAPRPAFAGGMAGGKCAGDQGLAARSSAERRGEETPDQQGSRLRQHALQHASGSPASSDSQMVEEYRLVHMRIAGDTESGRKKSEWV
ncbi:gap junction delta-4 protein [Rhinoraja longicauda]